VVSAFDREWVVHLAPFAAAAAGVAEALAWAHVFAFWHGCDHGRAARSTQQLGPPHSPGRPACYLRAAEERGSRPAVPTRTLRGLVAPGAAGASWSGCRDGPSRAAAARYPLCRSAHHRARGRPRACALPGQAQPASVFASAPAAVLYQPKNPGGRADDGPAWFRHQPWLRDQPGVDTRDTAATA
jgi:hypothetical protein